MNEYGLKSRDSPSFLRWYAQLLDGSPSDAFTPKSFREMLSDVISRSLQWLNIP